MTSQAIKKAMKHNARLPRTAGLRTISELSTSMTKAGLDPSRIEQRAELIAKARGLERKRKRDEEMDVDEEGGSGQEEDGEGEDGGDWMDVDGEGDDTTSPPKRRKTNTGTAVIAAGKHAPRTNRQTAGMRDQSQVSKAVKLRNLGQRERNMHAKAGESDRAIKTKMVSPPRLRVHSTRSSLPTRSRSTCFRGNENQERLRGDEFLLSCLGTLPCFFPIVGAPCCRLLSDSSSTHVTVGHILTDSFQKQRNLYHVHTVLHDPRCIGGISVYIRVSYTARYPRTS